MTKVLRRKITFVVPLSVYRSVCKYSECISQVCTLETSATGRWIQSGTYIMYQKVLWYAKYIYVFNKASLLSPAMFGPMVFVQHVFYTSKCSVHLALPAVRTVSTVW